MSFPIFAVHAQRQLKSQDGALDVPSRGKERAQSVVSARGRMIFHRLKQARDLFRSVFGRQARLGEGAGSGRGIRRGFLASGRRRLSDARRRCCQHGREAERQNSHARIFRTRSSATEHSSSPGAYLSTPDFFTSIFRAVSPSYRNGPSRRNEGGNEKDCLTMFAGTDTEI